MGVDKGEQGFGFAPRNNPTHKAIDSRPAGRRPSHAVPPPSSQQPAAKAADPAAPPQRAAWVWVLIGLLLGTGGTLLTSSLWLQTSDEREIAGIATGDTSRTSQANSGSRGHGEAVAMVADATATGADDTLAGSTAAAGSKIESTEGEPRPLSATRDDAPERNALETGNPKPETEEQLRTPPPSEALANTSTVTTPSLTSPASDLADNRTSGSERPSSDISPEQALAGLANTENLSQTPTAQLGETGSGRAAETRDVSTSVAIVSGDTETAALPPPSRPIEATPSKDSDRSELPPGIRQALQSSNDQPTAVSSGESGGSRLYRVQLAAFHNVRAAEKYWREVNQRLPGVFTDVEPIYNERVDDERAYLRIWVGAFENRLDADGYCGWLKQRGQDCFVTRVDNL